MPLKRSQVKKYKIQINSRFQTKNERTRVDAHKILKPYFCLSHIMQKWRLNTKKISQWAYYSRVKCRSTAELTLYIG